MIQLDSALHFAKFGFQVLPVNSSKRPALKWANASTDPVTIEDWAHQGYKSFCAIVGVGWVAVDLDKAKPNYQQPDWFVESPAMQKTASGIGEHHFYRIDGTIKNSQDQTNAVDIRGWRGIVVCYGFPEFEKAIDAPPQMLESLKKRTQPTSVDTNAARYFEEALQSIDPDLSEQDHYSVVVCGYNITGGYDKTKLALFNWSAQSDWYDFNEASEKVDTNWKAASQYTGVERIGWTEFLKIKTANPVKDFHLDYFSSIELTWDEIESAPDPVELVAGVLMASGITFLSSDAKAGKSTFIWAVLAKGCGDDWAEQEFLGHKRFKRQLTCWYASEENPSNIKALVNRVGGDWAKLKANVRVTNMAKMYAPDGANFREFITKMGREIRQMEVEQRPAMVVLDTISNLAESTNPNEAADVKRDMAAIIKAFGYADMPLVLVLSHRNKTTNEGTDLIKQITGSVNYGNALDNIIVLEELAGGKRVIRHKGRTSNDMESIYYTLDLATGEHTLASGESKYAVGQDYYNLFDGFGVEYGKTLVELEIPMNNNPKLKGGPDARRNKLNTAVEKTWLKKLEDPGKPTIYYKDLVEPTIHGIAIGGDDV